MKSKKILSLILVFVIMTSLLTGTVTIFAADGGTFKVNSCVPANNSTNVSPVDLKIVVTFSDDVSSSTINSSNVDVSGGVVGGFKMTNSRTLNIYLDKSKIELGTEYTVTLKNGIKSSNGASLQPYSTKFTTRIDTPQYWQLTNGNFDSKDDIYSYFDGNARKTLSLVDVDGRTALKVRPEWANGVAGQRVYCEGGAAYVARAVVMSEVDQQVQIQCCYYTESNKTNSYHYGPTVQLKANEWTEIEADFSIAEDVDGEVDIRVAFNKENTNGYIDFFQFYESGYDMEEKSDEANGISGVTVVNTGKSALQKFLALGVFSGGVSEDSEISRGEFARIMLGIVGLKDIPPAENNPFTDVQGEEADVACAAKQLGIMNGTSANTFESSQLVTFEQAVKTLISVMGWNNVAAQQGTYPNGCIAVARNIGILKNVMSNVGDKITYGTLAKMLDNALDSDVLVTKNFNATAEDSSYERTENFRKAYFDYEHVTGIIDGTSRTYLNKNGETSGNAITVDGVRYECYADVNEYLGYKADVYYKYNEDIGENEIFYICGLDDMNKTVEFSTSEADMEYTDGVYKINTDSGKKKTYVLNDKKNVIYNGKYLGSYDENGTTFVPVDGSIKLVDSGNGYDTVFITSVRTVAVSGVDTINNIIYDTYIGEPIDLSDTNELLITDKTGKVLKVNNIKSTNILSVVQSKDKEYAKITVSSDFMSGTICGIDRDGAASILTIGDSLYGSNVRSSAEIVPGYFDIDSVYTGLSGNFYLDSNGRIAAFKTTSETSSVGYLVKAVANEDETLMFKIYDQDNEMLTLKGAERISIDNRVYKTPADAVETLKKETSDVVSQLILYKTNGNGDVCYIDTAYNKLPNTSDYRTVVPVGNEDKDGFRVTYSSVMAPSGSMSSPSSSVFNTSSLSFNYKVQLTGNTKIFMVPLDAKNDDNVKFHVTNNYWELGNMYSSFIEAYMLSAESFTTDYLVVFLKSDQYVTEMMSSESYGIVKTTSKCLIDEEVLTKIELVSGKVVYAENELDANGVDPGDCISYKTDRRGRVHTPIKVAYDVSEREINGVSNSGFTDGNSSFNYVNVYEKRGSVLQVLDTAVDIASPNADIDANIMDISQATTWRYNREKNIVESGKQSDIIGYANTHSDYSTLIMLGSQSVVNTILIVD